MSDLYKIIEKNGKYGVICNDTGRTIPCEYDMIAPSVNSMLWQYTKLFKARRGSEIGCLDNLGVFYTSSEQLEAINDLLNIVLALDTEMLWRMQDARTDNDKMQIQRLYITLTTNAAAEARKELKSISNKGYNI